MYKRETKFLLPSEYKKEKALLAVQEAEDGQSPFQASIGIGTVIAIGVILAVIAMHWMGYQ